MQTLKTTYSQEVIKETQAALKGDLTMLVSRLLPYLEDDFAQLEPSQRIKLFESLLPYTIPKLKQIDTTVEDKRPEPIQLGIVFPDTEEPL